MWPKSTVFLSSNFSLSLSFFSYLVFRDGCWDRARREEWCFQSSAAFLHCDIKVSNPLYHTLSPHTCTHFLVPIEFLFLRSSFVIPRGKFNVRFASKILIHGVETKVVSHWNARYFLCVSHPHLYLQNDPKNCSRQFFL